MDAYPPARIYRVDGYRTPSVRRQAMLIDAKVNPTRLTRIAIDSRDRQIAIPSNKNSNSYMITLDEPIHDVISMTLVVADVPFVSYLIDASNNQLTMILADGSPPATATVPTGDYTGEALATALAVALAAQFPDQGNTTINTVYSALTDNISVACSMGFTLVFTAQGSIARELGFVPGSTYVAVSTNDKDSPDEYAVLPTFRRDSHTNPAIILSINNATVNTANNNNLDINKMSLNSTVNQSFAVLTPSRTLLCASTNELPFKTFNPPIAQLTQLSISFQTYDGNPVDFQNHEHRLELLLTSIRSAKYLPLDPYRNH